MEELQLIQQARLGNQEAWDKIVEIYGPPLYQLLVRFSGIGIETDDLYQEVFLRIYQKLNHYDSSRPFRPWLMKLAIHVALNYRSSQQMISKQLREEDATSEQSGSELAEIMEEIEKYLTKLPRPMRMAFLLYHYFSYSISEIAQIMDIPVSTAKSYLRRARLKLESLEIGKEAM